MFVLIFYFLDENVKKYNQVFVWPPARLLEAGIVIAIATAHGPCNDCSECSCFCPTVASRKPVAPKGILWVNPCALTGFQMTPRLYWCRTVQITKLKLYWSNRTAEIALLKSYYSNRIAEIIELKSQSWNHNTLIVQLKMRRWNRAAEILPL